MDDDKRNSPLKLTELDHVRLTAGDAFLAMGKFLSAYHDRTNGSGPIATICADVEVERDGISVDPAALSDWMQCVQSVLQEKTD